MEEVCLALTPGVVTLNLPRIGYESGQNAGEDALPDTLKNTIFHRPDELMSFAKESLEIKRKIIKDLAEKGLFPYSKYYLSEIKNKQGSFKILSSSISPTHGYMAGEHTVCPHSGESCEVYSRVVGYICVLLLPRLKIHKNGCGKNKVFSAF